MQSMYWHVWFKKKINLQFLLARVLSRDLDRLDYEDAKAAGKGAIHSLFWLLKKWFSPKCMSIHFCYFAGVFTGNTCRFTSPIYACSSKWLATQIKQQKQFAWNAKHDTNVGLFGLFGTLWSQIHLSNSQVVGREPFGATARVLYVRRSPDMMYGCSYPKGSIV